MNNKQRQGIYDYVCELNASSSDKSYSQVKTLGDWDILQLLYKSNSGNEMAALLLAEFLYYIERNGHEKKSKYESLKLYFS